MHAGHVPDTDYSWVHFEMRRFVESIPSCSQRANKPTYKPLSDNRSYHYNGGLCIKSMWKRQYSQYAYVCILLYHIIIMRSVLPQFHYIRSVHEIIKRHTAHTLRRWNLTVCVECKWANLYDDHNERSGVACIKQNTTSMPLCMLS